MHIFCFFVFIFVLNSVVHSPPRTKTLESSCSCFGFRVPVCGLWVPVFCNVPQSVVVHHFFVMCPHITQHVWGGGGGALQKKWHITKNGFPKPANWYPKTRNKNSVFCLPRTLFTILFYPQTRNTWSNNAHSLIATPYLAIIALKVSGEVIFLNDVVGTSLIKANWKVLWLHTFPPQSSNNWSGLFQSSVSKYRSYSWGRLHVSHVHSCFQVMYVKQLTRWYM